MPQVMLACTVMVLLSVLVHYETLRLISEFMPRLQQHLSQGWVQRQLRQFASLAGESMRVTERAEFMQQLRKLIEDPIAIALGL